MMGPKPSKAERLRDVLTRLKRRPRPALEAFAVIERHCGEVHPQALARAKKKVGIRSKKKGDGRWWWYPVQDQPSDLPSDTPSLSTPSVPHNRLRNGRRGMRQ